MSANKATAEQIAAGMRELFDNSHTFKTQYWEDTLQRVYGAMAALTQPAQPAEGGEVDRGHLYDLRYVLDVLHKVRALISDQDAAHVEIGAAITGMRYVVDRTERTAPPASQEQAPNTLAGQWEAAHGHDKHGVAAWLRAKAGQEQAQQPSGHIKEPYSVAEIKAKITSGDYSAEMLLQHAMLHLAQQPSDPHLFEFWWETHMPQSTQAEAWAAWQAAQTSNGVGIEQQPSGGGGGVRADRVGAHKAIGSTRNHDPWLPLVQQPTKRLVDASLHPRHPQAGADDGGNLALGLDDHQRGTHRLEP